MQECLYKGYPSEMVLLQKYYGNSPCLDRMYPEIASYKMDIQTKFVSIRESSIVYFHGKPKPHELPGEPWVRHHWV